MPEFPGPIGDTADALVDRHGPDEAFARVVVSIDLGYSLDQVLAAADIDAAGSIAGVEPAGAPLGLVVAEPAGFAPAAATREAKRRGWDSLDLLLSDVHGRAAALAADDLVAEWRAEQAALEAAEVERARQEAIEFESIRMTAYVMMLLGRGYTLEQAVEGLYFGELENDDGLGCVRLPSVPAGTPIGSVDCEPIEGAIDTTASSTPDTSEPVETSAPSVDAGEPERTEWAGSVEYADDTVPFEFIDSSVTITRTPGTDDFAISAFLEYRTLPADCSFDWRKTYEGTGVLAGDRIVFDGTATVVNSSTCADPRLVDSTTQERAFVDVTPSGLQGLVIDGDFFLEGTATPTG
jgi:hypothetical protein